jgi:fucose 4-O-acetylase-like acetyltransferase
VSRTISPPPEEVSRRAIGIARVLCILGIVYVHAWTGRTGETLTALSDTPQGILRWALIELVGRCAVPLLGSISGWLSGPSARKRSYRGFVGVKARTILAPMILWNLIAMLLVGGFAFWGQLKAPTPGSLWEATDWTLCLTQPNPINVQISFLRDLFLCMLAAPLLARLSDRWLYAIAAAVLLWSASGMAGPILLRPPILLFFLIGMIARRRGWAERIAGWPLRACLLPFVAILVPKILFEARDELYAQSHVVLSASIDLPLRIAAALAVWRIACALARVRAGRPVVALERYAFLLFCSHLIFIWLFGPAIGLLTGKLGAPLYPPFLILQPLLVLGCAIVAGRMLLALWPAAATLLSGGRLRREQRLPPAAASVMERATPPPGATP